MALRIRDFVIESLKGFYERLPLKKISVNGTEITPDASGVADITVQSDISIDIDGSLYTPDSSGVIALNVMGEQEELAISAALNDLNDRIDHVSDDSPWESGEGEKSAQLKGTAGAVGEGAVVHAYGSDEDRIVRPLWYISYAYADSQEPGAYNYYYVNYDNNPDFKGLYNEDFYALIYDGSTYTVSGKGWSEFYLDNPLPISNGECELHVQVIYSAPGLATASGEYSHAEGYVTNAIGDYSHAEGNGAQEYSHAPGGIFSVSENSWMFYGIDPEEYNYYLRFSNSDYYDKTAIDALFEDMCNSMFKDWDDGNAVSLNLYSKPACGNEDFICDIFAYDMVMPYTYDDGEGGYGRGLLFYYDGIISDCLPAYSNALKFGAKGKYSHTEGVNTLTFGEGAHAEGYSTTANGDYSHAEGVNTVANSYISHAEGTNTAAEGDGSHAEGTDTSAFGYGSHAEGYYTHTTNSHSHAEGYYTTASGEYSHAEGHDSYTGGRGSHAEGYDTSAYGTCSHAEGSCTYSLGEYSHAEGFARERNYDTKFIDVSYVNSYWDGTSNYDLLYISSTNIPNTGSLLQYRNSFYGDRFIKAQYKNFYGKTFLAIPRNIVSYTESNARMYIIAGTYGDYAHAEGLHTTADGSASHAEGYNTIAGGYVSHAEGNTTMSQGDYSHTEGKYNIAKGVGSHAEGHPDSSTKDVSMYMTYRTRYIDSSVCYVSDGSIAGYAFYQRNQVGTMLTDGSTDYYIIAPGDYNNKFNTLITDMPLPGVGIAAYDSSRYILRYYNLAKGLGSHAEGNNTKAFGNHSHTEGINARAWGKGSHAEGYQTEALSFCKMKISGNKDSSQYVVSDTSALRSGMFIVCNGEHALIKKIDSSIRITLDRTLKKDTALDASGFLIVTRGAIGEGSHTEGYNTTASGIYSHAEGYNTTASGIYSHAEGYNTTASGYHSHAEGYNTTASGYYSHAEGYNTTASGSNSHAEGEYAAASGSNSHAEGYHAAASGYCSHAEGNGKSKGQASHAEGTGTASGNYSHAEGNSTDASGLYSHAEGSGMTKYYYFNLYTSIADSSVNQNFTLNTRERNPFKLGDIISVDSVTDTSIGTVIAVTEHSFRLDKRITSSFNTDRYFPFYIRNLDGYDGSSGKAFGNASHTEGVGTQAFNLGEHANGYYNKSNTDISLLDDTSTCTLFTIGCGGIAETDSSHWFERRNAVEVLRNGDVYITGIGGYDGTNPGYENSSTLQEVIEAGGGGSSVYTLETDTSVMTHCVYKQGSTSTPVYEAVVPVHTGSYYELYDTSNTHSGAYFSPYTSPSDKHFEISATGDDAYFSGSKLILGASIIGWNFTSPVTMFYDASITGYKAYTSIPFEYFDTRTIEGILVRYTEAIMM